MTRRGTTLADLLVALCLGGVVIALCARAVIGQRRAERTVALASADATSVDEALRVLTSMLRRVTADDSLVMRGDTALEWRAVIGAAVACAAAADTVVVPDSGAGAWWEAYADSGDALAVRQTADAWSRAVIVGVRTRASGGACGAAQRTLRFRTPPTIDARLGVPVVRVTRRVRFTLYRGGDGAWWLGERTCDAFPPVSCGAAQPVAGPLGAPPRGLHFALDASSTPILIDISVAAGRTIRATTVAIER